MAAEQRSATRTRGDADAPAPAPDIDLEFRSPLESALLRTDDPDEVPTELVLSHRIERTKLQSQIAALERELQASEHRRTQIITQYERLLEERTTEQERTRDECSKSGLLGRLFDGR
ncbi:hypothetical protein [Natrarchaeobaculum sulfurireducens]|uniref:Uncharacterized protein n=1 Tax=Natrarchaeobaculum sulfurireducens TaxID=2044521 RepID=A0A346PJV2_9EURY|nr:hypothetical protein [Natrarchaeobaculum sulfurireducens]AXR79797.1 hypothetical protein AArc1_3505 [Natrarchaeobaculum sulfurireducens]AXR83534.1 hypothetical protein AArcMg_3561 [Natrarchaeobaculum sulfurireducens]